MNNLPPGMTRTDLAHVNGEDCVDVEDLVSECCGAHLLGEGEGGTFCSECKEHAEGERVDYDTPPPPPWMERRLKTKKEKTMKKYWQNS